MPEPFLHLTAEEQSQIYRAPAPRLARSPVVLEKDVWVCWALQTLFALPDRPPMAFKGGASLSKVFGAIARFSEDLDITLDYRGLGSSFDPFSDGVSRSRLRKFSEELKSFVRGHVRGVVEPHFRRTAAAEFDADALRLAVGDDGERLRLSYPTVLGSPGDYLGNSVLIEFGGRNITEPNEAHEVRPDIAEHLPELDFPCPTVNVLSPARTFWGKATLIRVECRRDEFRVGAERPSRHWYDLAMLADHPHGQSALADRALLADVVKHKKVFHDRRHRRSPARARNSDQRTQRWLKRSSPPEASARGRSTTIAASPIRATDGRSASDIRRRGGDMDGAANSLGIFVRAVAFAAAKHRRQRRDDVESSPYINHPIAVADVLANEGGVADPTILCAAALHDTVEDTATTSAELAAAFGPEIAAVVGEVTDDMSLEKAARKRRQIERAARISREAKLVKLADKICNLRDILAAPPADWTAERKRAYFDWAALVVAGVRGVHPGLEAEFDRLLARRDELR